MYTRDVPSETHRRGEHTATVDALAAGVGGHFRRPVAPRVLGRLPADLGYEPIAEYGRLLDVRDGSVARCERQFGVCSPR
jgi:hypothetical protein